MDHFKRSFSRLIVIDVDYNDDSNDDPDLRAPGSDVKVMQTQTSNVNKALYKKKLDSTQYKYLKFYPVHLAPLVSLSVRG